MRKDARIVAADYGGGIAERGVTLSGVGWPDPTDLAVRYEVLLSPIDFLQYSRERPLRLLDLGCGPGFLLDFLKVNGLLDRIDYMGVDICETSLEHARKRWPSQRFEFRDVRDAPFHHNAFDYCVICGAWTSLSGLSFEEMKVLFEETLKAVWPAVELGVGYNVMSKHVDWERDDLFHYPLDSMMAFLKANLSRHVSFRLDYNLWEASALVSKTPIRRRAQVPDNWSIL